MHLARAFVCSTLVIVAACAGTPPVPGNTGADERLQTDIRRIITILERTSEPRCDVHRIVNTERAGLGRERWTVERCGERVVYLVTFIVGRPGATDLSVRREDAAP